MFANHSADGAVAMTDTENNLADRFAVVDGRPAIRNPLERENIRFNHLLNQWRLYSLESTDAITVQAVDRTEILEKGGISAEALARWEQACVAAGVPPCPFGALDLRDDGTVLSGQPLLAWNYAYYPTSRLWRRTRSHRDEVPPEKMAKRVGVPLALIRRWEAAVAEQPKGFAPER